jgi:electron transfer flavoprotein alpha subunit
MAVLVFVENNEGTIKKAGREAVYYASETAKILGTNCMAATYGEIPDDELSELGQYGVDRVIVAKGITQVDGQQLSRFVGDVVENNSIDTVVMAMNPTGNTLAPRLTARLSAGSVTGVISLPNIDNGFVVTKNVYAGKASANYKVTADKRVLTIMPNTFSFEAAPGSATVENWGGDAGVPGVKIREVKKAGGAVPLPEAERVVSGGRGLKGPENWAMVEELATLLDAQLACSRPVADMDWRPHHEHVGQTGIAIRPDLYIAIGISGAIQHLAGVNGSKVIVVVNTDPEAPFFKAADYGIIGDAFEVVPKLVEAAKAFDASK